MNFLKTLVNNIELKRFEKRYIFQYGYPAFGLPSSTITDIFTENAFDVIYDMKTKKYQACIEPDYFPPTTKERKEYLSAILKDFTKVLTEMDYDTKEVLTFDDIFYYGANINMESDNILEIYQMFKFLVRGFSKND